MKKKRNQKTHTHIVVEQGRPTLIVSGEKLALDKLADAIHHAYKTHLTQRTTVSSMNTLGHKLLELLNRERGRGYTTIALQLCQTLQARFLCANEQHRSTLIQENESPGFNRLNILSLTDEDSRLAGIHGPFVIDNFTIMSAISDTISRYEKAMEDLQASALDNAVRLQEALNESRRNADNLQAALNAARQREQKALRKIARLEKKAKVKK